MTELQTSRLVIEPAEKDNWLIRDKSDFSVLGQLFFHEQWFNINLNNQSQGLGVATEATYTLLRFLHHPRYQAHANTPQTEKFLIQLGFKINDSKSKVGTNKGGKRKDSFFEVQANELLLPDIYLKLNQRLGIDTPSLNTTQHLTTCQLTASDTDCFKRPTRLNPHADQAWKNMKKSAQQDGIELLLASAFRSMRYQAGLIQRKMDLGASLSEILKTNTAPGHSEHHTGRAIDITTSGFKPLEETFDQSPAFTWLNQHANQFGFIMSYPKNNDQGIIYEPWHWCYHSV